MQAIAIDGPAGAGKSTISKTVAKKMNMVYIDTGAMFRTIALYFINNKYDLYDEAVVNNYIDEINIDIKCDGQINNIFLNGEEVSKHIRTENVSKCASIVAKNKKVREKLLLIQREIANRNTVVMDGRDVGTCVLPNADLKIYLVADVEERARRRYEQLIKKDKDVTFEEVIEDLKLRDLQDTTRKISPLKKAEDAVNLDTTDKTIEEVADIIIKLADERSICK